MALMSYLLKDRHGTYYFRRIVPPALRPFMPAPWTGKVEWKQSLRTKKPDEAKNRTARVLAACMDAFNSATRLKRGEPAVAAQVAHLDASTLAELEANTIAALLGNDAAARADGDDRRHLQTEEERAQWPDLMPVSISGKGMAEDFFAVHGDLIEEDLAAYQGKLARSDPSIVRVETAAALRPYGLDGNLSRDEVHEAGLAVLRGHVKAYRLMLDRQRGEPVDTPKPTSSKGPRLSEAFTSWKTGGDVKGAKQPGANTIREAEHAVRRFKEWHGDLRLGDISREKVREFREALAKVPTRLKGDLRKLPLREVLKHPDAVGPPAHASTINKSLQLLSAVVSDAVRDGHMDTVPGFANPFDKGMKLAIDKRLVEDRQIFEPADLRAIFGAGVFVAGDRPNGGGGEAAFWLPLIGLLSGARQSEIAQLRIADLRADPETGIWFFDISTEGDRLIKTASSRRRVPVHPELERIGLLRYRQWLIERGAAVTDPLWPDVKSDAQGRRAGPWSKWFNRWKSDKAGVTDASKVFHSFRHTFIRYARTAKLDEELRNALTGHTGGGVGRAYGGGFDLRTLKDGLASIEAPKPLKALSWAAPKD